jgi:biotin transport system substrate-specific component
VTVTRLPLDPTTAQAAGRTTPWRTVARRAIPVILFAALTAVSGMIRVYIPGNPVPFTLQVMAVLLAGACLRPTSAMASMSLFLAAGLSGLPVFAGNGAGPAYLIGPSGGYLLGFLVAAPLVSLLTGSRREGFARVVLAMTAGVLAIHILGGLHLALYFGGAFPLALSTTAHFLPLDLVKIAAAAAIVSGGSTWVRRGSVRS